MSTKEIDWLDRALAVYDQTPLRMPHDPLSMSVAAWRQAVQSNYRMVWNSLSTPSAEDQILADEIKQHYRDRIMLKMLTRPPLSQYQSELYRVLDTDLWLKSNMGMLMTLPFFYHEDCLKQQIKDQTQTPTQIDNRSKFLIDLVPLQKIYVVRQKNSKIEYWFETENNFPVVWTVGLPSDFRDLVEGFWSRPRLSMRTLLQKKSSHLCAGFEYLEMTKPEMP